MNAGQMTALMPLIILAAGSVLVLVAGAVRTGWYLYELTGALIFAAAGWSLLMPVDALVPGMTFAPFSRFVTILVCLAGLAGLMLASGYNRRRGISGEEFPATLLFAMTGLTATASASNLLMLFLGLESFTFAFYILVAIERGSERGGEAGLKYLLNGTLAAALLAMGIALVYCAGGTLDLAPLAPGGVSLGAAGICLMLLGLAFKLSLVPLHLWTPDVYQGAPAPVTALLSTISKTVAAVALLLLMPMMSSWNGSHDLLWWLALLSMLAGNLAALSQHDLKRLLAWSSVGQMGYVALAFVAADSAAAVFYVVAYSIAGLASFGAVAAASTAREADGGDGWRGVGYRYPLLGATLAVAMFSLAGIPPTVGFMAKFAVFRAALRAGEHVLAVIGALAAVASVFAYLRVVVWLYMKPSATQGEIETTRPSRAEAVTLLAALLAMLLVGIMPSILLDRLPGILPFR